MSQLMKSMKAVIWNGDTYPSSLCYGDFPQPETIPGWVKVKNIVAGICGSDLHYLVGQGRDLIPDVNLPAVLGHENAGIVVEVGDGVTGVQPGDRVAIEPLHGCMQFGKTCPMCQIGKYHLCKDGLVHVGIPLVKMLPGGYGEYSIAHSSRIFSMPDNVTFEDAALLDILAVDVHAVKIAQPSLGDSAVVLGCGIIGLDLIPCLIACGVTDVIAIAKYSFQAQAARNLGAKMVVDLESGTEKDPVKAVLSLTNGWGVDQVYECVGGETDALDQSISMVRKGGKVIMLGVFPGYRPINLRMMLRKEVNILVSNSYSTSGLEREYKIAMNMLSDGQAKHADLVTHRYTPDQFLPAIETSMNKKKFQNIKTVFIRNE